MRDFEHIRQVQEYRVTGPQLVTALVLVAAGAAGAFFFGYELGLLQRPVEPELLAPAAGEEREAELALAELLAEQATPAPQPTTATEQLRAEAESADVAGRPPGGLTADELRAATAEQGEGLTVVDDTRPTPEPTPEPTPQPTPGAVEDVPSLTVQQPHGLPGPPPGATGFTVQMAAYDDTEQARSLIEALRSKSYEAFHMEAEVDGRTWHRVRVGIYATREEADEAVKRLEGVGPFPPFVAHQP